MEAKMRNMMVIAAAGAPVIAAAAFLIKSTPTGATQVSQSPSSLELMSNAKNLPVARTPTRSRPTAAVPSPS
jgi:hypothetical protein